MLKGLFTFDLGVHVDHDLSQEEEALLDNFDSITLSNGFVGSKILDVAEHKGLGIHLLLSEYEIQHEYHDPEVDGVEIDIPEEGCVSEQIIFSVNPKSPPL